jgi:hypothetical protein
MVIGVGAEVHDLIVCVDIQRLLQKDEELYYHDHRCVYITEGSPAMCETRWRGEL